jgi:hypothetical protein
MAIKILILMATTTLSKMTKIPKKSMSRENSAGQISTGTTANGSSNG